MSKEIGSNGLLWYILGIVKALVAAYIVTGLLLFMVSFAMYKLGLGDSLAELMITFIYILSSAVGGLLIGKTTKQRKFIFGALVGLIYAVIVCLISIIAGASNDIGEDCLSMFLLSVAGGMFGGMIS